MNQKTVTFLINGTPHHSTGGVKVVYQYSNFLVSNGFKINIIYSQKRMKKENFKTNLINILKYVYKILFGVYHQKWFLLDNMIKEKYVYEFTDENVPLSDIYIATNVQSSYYLSELTGKNNSKKYYLIQDYENWIVSDDFVIESYKLGLNNLVVSDWLYEKVCQFSSNVKLIYNGFDFNYFSLSNPIENRDIWSISVMYHPEARKRFDDTYQALKILKDKYPKIHVLMFGGYDFCHDAVDWIKFYKLPNKELHNYIYNNSSIFINASEKEGWGLTVGEAMICGCAVVCADNDGHRIVAKDRETALLFEPRNINEMVNKVELLINDDSLRVTLARNGNAYIQKFSWDESYKKLLNLFSGES